MDKQIFWNVIGNYNEHTKCIQAVLLIILSISLILSYSGKVKWMAKLVLGIINLYIGVVFFGIYGTESVQKFFALPLYLLCGVLFIYECIYKKDDRLKKPTRWQIILLLSFKSLCFFIDSGIYSSGLSTSSFSQ